MNNQPELTHIDLNFNEFVSAIYKHEPAEPFAYQLEFLDQMNPEELRKLLAYFIITGAKTIYSKELAQLLPNEIEYLRKYLLSIGFKVEFKIEKRLQKLDPNDQDKETPVNYFLIDFIPASSTENKVNVVRPLE